MNEPTRDKNLLDLVLTTNNDIVNNLRGSPIGLAGRGIWPFFAVIFGI